MVTGKNGDVDEAFFANVFYWKCHTTDHKNRTILKAYWIKVLKAKIFQKYEPCQSIVLKHLKERQLVNLLI
jgi:hypothetical protein